MDCSANEFKNASPFVAPAMKVTTPKAFKDIKIKVPAYRFIYRHDYESIDSFMYRYERAKAAYEESQTEENDMATSKDRVRFCIPVQRLSVGFQEGANPYRKVLCDTLGFSMAELKCHIEQCQDQIEFICRPSQFARFTIARNDAGISNSFKELSPELFTPLPKPSAIDCSENPARHC